MNSKLSNALGFGGSESPDEGADTPAWLASSDDPGPAGAYYANRRVQACSFSRDRARNETLLTVGRKA